MRNFELDKTVTLREVQSALELATSKAPSSEAFSHEVYAGDLGYLDVECDNSVSYEGFTEYVLRELL